MVALQKVRLLQRCQVGIHATACRHVALLAVDQTHLVADSGNHAVGLRADVVPLHLPTCNTMFISYFYFSPTCKKHK